MSSHISQTTINESLNLDENIKQLLNKALQRSKNLDEAAGLLGVSKRCVRNWIFKFQIDWIVIKKEKNARRRTTTA